MEHQCVWCESEKIIHGLNTVHWELPDGTRAIVITDTPSVICNNCKMIYQSDEIVKAIEDQLFLINTNIIGQEISYTNLMNQQRMLKKNYFDFTT